MRQKCDPQAEHCSSEQGLSYSNQDSRAEEHPETTWGKILKDTLARPQPQEVKPHWAAEQSRHYFCLEITASQSSDHYSYGKLKCLWLTVVRKILEQFTK